MSDDDLRFLAGKVAAARLAHTRAAQHVLDKMEQHNDMITVEVQDTLADLVRAGSDLSSAAADLVDLVMKKPTAYEERFNYLRRKLTEL